MKGRRGETIGWRRGGGGGELKTLTVHVLGYCFLLAGSPGEILNKRRKKGSGGDAAKV